MLNSNLPPRKANGCFEVGAVGQKHPAGCREMSNGSKGGSKVGREPSVGSGHCVLTNGAKRQRSPLECRGPVHNEACHECKDPIWQLDAADKLDTRQTKRTVLGVEICAGALRPCSV